MATSSQYLLLAATLALVLFIGSASAGGGSYACPAGFKDCDPHKPGCETCVASDVNNCGDCGAKCKHVRYATAKCEGGRCKYTCDAGWTNCDGNWATGCEVDIKSDAKNCGACQKPCQHVRNAVTKCVGGKCAQPVCDAGWANCDGNWATGCEKNLKSDVLNCGKCGHKCPCTLKGGEPTCSAGKCGEKCKSGSEYNHEKKCCVPY